MLPELSLLRSVRLCGPRYWTYTLDVGSGGDHAALLEHHPHGVVLWAKRKQGHLSYVQDPQGKCNLLAGVLPPSAGTSGAGAGEWKGGGRGRVGVVFTCR